MELQTKLSPHDKIYYIDHGGPSYEVVFAGYVQRVEIIVDDDHGVDVKYHVMTKYGAKFCEIHEDEDVWGSKADCMKEIQRRERGIL